MAKNKNNYVSYELERLEKYVQQLQNFLDKNPPDLMEDRIQYLTSTQGNPIVKVISTKEQQLKSFTETLQKVPKLLEDLNHLRKVVEAEEEEKEVRGDSEIPGFMIGYKSASNVTEENVIPFDDDDDNFDE
jgi:hypothetical protein